MRDPFKRPAIRVSFMCDGGLLQREWALFDPDITRIRDALADGPPEWLEDPKRAWEHPQDPITFTGVVRDGWEDEAREFVHGG